MTLTLTEKCPECGEKRLLFLRGSEYLDEQQSLAFHCPGLTINAKFPCLLSTLQASMSDRMARLSRSCRNLRSAHQIAPGRYSSCSGSSLTRRHDGGAVSETSARVTSARPRRTTLCGRESWSPERGNGG